jgi:LPXTG-motif cell wall-anchored protein
MNFRIFGVFIIIAGLIVAGFGAYKLNKLHDALIFKPGWIDARAARIPEESQGPISIIIIGGVVALIGIGMVVSAKKKKSDE